MPFLVPFVLFVFGSTSCHQAFPSTPWVADVATSFDAFQPRDEALDGSVVILGESAEVDERESVERVLSSFLADALPYVAFGFQIKTLIVLDPELVSEATSEPTPGVCYQRSRTIVLNRTLWRHYSDVEREIVLYHELGHCELDRRHTSGRLDGGGPVSLMNQGTVRDASFYLAGRTYYLRELFVPVAGREPRFAGHRRSGLRQLVDFGR